MLDLTGLTILVVEDDFFIAEEIASALSAPVPRLSAPPVAWKTR
jgi:hypothetical protein